ncbi:dermonecrotic toxin domain-containing protein [Rouxiella badensis]|uniref:dermonecrotic toxin domain-containing protein n=1 Tax=Rouxiella badensis TaxID=1646377 RepID=UPI00301C6B0D
MLSAALLEESNRVINRAEREIVNPFNFRKVNVYNSGKNISSDKKIINFKDELYLANQCPRIIPGEGTLPPMPDLELVPSAKATAMIAAVQLLTQTLGCVDVSKKPTSQAHTSPTHPSPAGSTSTYSDSLSQILDHGKRWGSRLDNNVDSVMQKIWPWSVANAHPVIQLDPDDERMTVSRHSEPHPTQSLLDEAQNLSQARNRKAYLNTVNKIKENYPKLYELASNYIKASLSKNQQYRSLNIDPDKTWFNRFERSSSSSESYTGWEHHNHPKESTTLTQMLLNNFGAEDRLNSDALSGNSGIYNQGAEANYFGAVNEVKILPKDFLNIVIKSDFSKKFLKELKTFWLINSSSYRTVIKGKFLSLMADKSNNLSELGEDSVMMGVLGDIRKLPFMTMDELEKKNSKRTVLKVSSFSIYGYHATDIILIHGFNGRIILYKPTEDESFVEFNNSQELNNWVLQQVRHDGKRQSLLEHFSLYDRQDGQTYSGVYTALKGLASGDWAESYINYKSLDIKGDVFTWLAVRAQERTIKDAETLTVTNNEVLKDQLLMNLKPVLITAGIGTMILPGVGSLVLLGAGAVEMEVGVNINIYGDTEAKRFAGLAAAIDGGINVLFGTIGVVETVPVASVQNSPPISWFNRVLKRTVLHGKGLAGITRYSVGDALKLTDTLSKMDQTLLKARGALRTGRGKDIVAAYLGYEEGSSITDADIQFVRRNIDSLMTVHEAIGDESIVVKAVKIYDPKRQGVHAYYEDHKKSISFDDKFFGGSDDNRLHVLLHEGMHATAPYRLDEFKAGVPDYFYTSTHFSSLHQLRDDTLEISAGAVGLDFQREYHAEPVVNNFIEKMGAKGRGEARRIFKENSELRKELLLVNPDTQAMLIMELGDQVPGERAIDGAFKTPDSVKNFRAKVIEQQKQEAKDAEYGPVAWKNNNEQESRLR